MPLVAWIWAVWGVSVLLYLSLKIYESRLSRDEDDQLVLDDSFVRIREEQAAIVARVNRVQPLVRAALVLLGVMTLFVIGYYVMDIVHQFQ